MEPRGRHATNSDAIRIALRSIEERPAVVGVRELKGVGEPVRVFAVRARG